jgi:hypothetical protein
VPAIVCNVAGIGSLAQQKFDDRSLIMLHLKRIVDVLSDTKQENNYTVSGVLETDLIDLTFRRVHTLEINFREKRALHLGA